jgi:negative regulator of flagellin synthesis FlgM
MAGPIQGVNRSDAIRIVSEARTGAAAGTPQANAAPAAALDSAQTGKTEALLALINLAAASLPPIDEARIAALRQAIADGTLAPDEHAIASKIAELEARLAGAGEPG